MGVCINGGSAGSTNVGLRMCAADSGRWDDTVSFRVYLRCSARLDAIR